MAGGKHQGVPATPSDHSAKKPEPQDGLGHTASVPNALSADMMLGPFFKEYADLGHWFNAAHDRCLHCGTPTIDLYEDGSFGPIRACAPKAK